MKRKNLLMPCLILLMLLLLCYPNLCLSAAQKGLLLWFNKVLPSLLPFMILINLIVPLNVFGPLAQISHPTTKCLWHLPGESFFACLMGLMAGYPMGAKVTYALYHEEKLDLNEARATLCFCNNCGPLFIVGTVGTAMLGCTSLGYFLLLIHMLSVLCMSFLVTHPLPTLQTKTHHLSQQTTADFTTLLNQAVMQSMDTIVCVGGYIIFFSVLLSLLTDLPLIKQLLHWLPTSLQTTWHLTMGCLLEISNGAYQISLIPTTIYTIALLSSCISFGGCCVYFQMLHVLEGHHNLAEAYLPAKCIQALISFGLTLLLYPFYLVYTQSTQLIFKWEWLFLAVILGGCAFTLSFPCFKCLSHHHTPMAPIETASSPSKKQAC